MPLAKRVILLFFPLMFFAAGNAYASCELSSSTRYIAPNSDVDLTINLKNSGDTVISWIQIPISYPSAVVTLNSQTIQESGWTLGDGTDPFIYTGSLQPNDSLHFNVSLHTADERPIELTWQTSAESSGDPSTDCSPLSLEITSTPPQPPVISNSSLSVNNNSAVLTWNTDIDATSVVNYGTSTSYGSSVTTTSGKTHTVTMASLSSSTTYHYQIQVTSTGGTTTTNDATFTTAAADVVTTTTTTVTNTVQTVNTVVKTLSDTTPPVVSLTTNLFKPLKEAGTLTGKASDTGTVNAGLASIEYSLDGGKNWLPVDNITSLGSKSSTFEFSPGNLDDGNYKIKLRAKDFTGNVGTSKEATLVIDRLPPQVGSSIFSIGPMILHPDINGNVYSLTGIPLKVILSAIGGPITMKLDLASQNYSFIKNLESGLWSSTLNINLSGKWEPSIKSVDGANNETERKLNTIITLPAGQVSDTNQKSISNATVKVYIYDKYQNDFTLWEAEPYLQSNPQQTDANGNYHLILPSGKYFIEIESSGKRKIRTEIFEINNPTPINQSFSLEQSFFWGRWWSKTVPISIANFENTNNQTPSSLIGKPIPEFNLSTSTEEFSNTSILGKPTIITFLSSWEPQTSDQILALEKFKNDNSGVNVFVVTVQESISKTNIFKKTGGYSLPIIADPDGIFVLPLSLQSLPTHIFLDRKGIIKEVTTGYINAENLLNKVLN